MESEYTNTTLLSNISDFTNSSNQNFTYVEEDCCIDEVYYKVVQICIAFLLICCLLAMCVNCLVIISIYWIRNPMTPNLKISLSLAVADALSSSMTGILLLMEKLEIEELGVFPCIAELIRLSGIVITVLHLLALSFNHYIGIMKPLHYNVIVTKRKVSIAIAILWVSPIVLLVALSTLENNGELLMSIRDNTCEVQIFSTFASRLSYSFLFFFPIILMVTCYTHILITVKRQQSKWKNVSRTGSSKYKGRSIKSNNTSQKAIREQARLQGNIKAVYTTLFILGSCFIGWMPALIFYILTCKDCPINGEALNTLNRDYKYEVMSLRLIENTLVILKMLANPIIYTIRIKEIKDSTNRMYLAIAGLFCPSRRNNNAYGLAYQPSRKQTSVITSQIRMNSFRTSTETQHGSECENPPAQHPNRICNTTGKHTACRPVSAYLRHPQCKANGRQPQRYLHRDCKHCTGFVSAYSPTHWDHLPCTEDGANTSKPVSKWCVTPWGCLFCLVSHSLPCFIARW